MTLEAWYDPEDRVREERFFRNLCGYLIDCTTAAAAAAAAVDGGSRGMTEGAASIPQLALFSWEADTMMCEPSTIHISLLLLLCLLYLSYCKRPVTFANRYPTLRLVVALRVPKAIGIPASTALTWFLGVFVGKWMLGYQASYDEYFHEMQ